MFLEILFAVVIAILFSAVLGGLFGWELPGRRGVWPSLLFLFFLIFIATFAASAWVSPFGPHYHGIYWLPIVLTGLIITLLVAALIPPRRPRTRREAIKQAAERAETEWTFGMFFWLLMLLFGIAIIARFV